MSILFRRAYSPTGLEWGLARWACLGDTQNWLPGKKFLISPRSILETDWSARIVNIGVSRRTVQESPAYDRSKDIDRAYEYEFHRYYDDLPMTEPVD